MLRKSLRCFHLLLVCVLFAVSCKKPDCGQTVDDLAGVYRLSSRSVGDDPPMTLSICEKEMLYTLNKNGTAVLDQPGSCNGYGEGTWGINAGKFFINVFAVNGYDVRGAQILSYDCSTLVVEDPATLGSVKQKLVFQKD